MPYEWLNNLDALLGISKAIADVPAWNWTLQALGLITSYIGAVLNAKGRITGFYIWLFSNVTLGILHYATGLWLLLLLDILYFRVNIMGVVNWSRDKPEQAPRWLLRYLK